VKSRVVGNITKINFKEGQEVRAGDLLVQIDPRPFQATLDQAAAALARDQANLANAKLDLARYAGLVKRNYVSEQQYQTQIATVQASEATVNADRAAVDAAKLNLEYCSISSPIDGITGIRQVDLGNLVQANSQTLVVVTQIKPVYVVFSLPEADIWRVRSAMQKRALQVEAYDAADRNRVSRGVLELVDNQVDQTTGTVRFKARFQNADERLWPGQFVNAHLVLDVVKNGVTVPSAAIQTGPESRFAYVVRPDDTVEMRPVTVLQTENNVALIGAGLQIGDRVVVAGQSRLSPGAKVTVSQEPQEAPPPQAQSGQIRERASAQ
jgi:multidrug efflux system membrane fusion protein